MNLNVVVAHHYASMSLLHHIIFTRQNFVTNPLNNLNYLKEKKEIKFEI